MSNDSPIRDDIEPFTVDDLPGVRQVGDQKWEVRVSYRKEPSGDRKWLRRHVTGDLEDALELREKLKLDAKKGRPSGIDPDAVTVGTLYEEFDELRQGRTRWGVAASTYQSAKSVFDTKILPFVEDWRVSEIQRSDINRLIDHWSTMEKQRGGGQYSPHSVNKWIRNLRILLRFCCERIDRDIGFLDGIRGLSTSEVSKKGRSLTPDERDLFLETTREIAPQYFALMKTLLVTGQRWGSTTALRWQDLDWNDGENGSLHFQRSHYQGKVKTGSKTGREITLPMPSGLAQAIRWHEQTYRDDLDHPGFQTTDLMFPARVARQESERNAFLGPDTGRAVCKRVCREAGIEPVITPHDLRRTMVTLALEGGMSPETVKSITGHCQAMLSHYLHSTGAGRQAVLETVEGGG
jgi:integrase